MSNPPEMPMPECCVCFTPYDEGHKPLTLTECGHTFCEKCVKRIKVEDKRWFQEYGVISTKSVTSYDCPTCKQKSFNYICNYEVIKIYNEYTELSKKLKPPDPIEKSLNEHLQMTIKEIEIKTTKYTELKKKVSQLTEEIRMLEHHHHPMFDAHYEKVKVLAKKEADKIIEEAKHKVEKMILDGKCRSEFEAHKRFHRLEQDYIISQRREKRKLEEAQEKFKEHMRMEEMMKTNKRNFINHYDKMIDTLSEFKQLIKSINMTFTDTKSNTGSPKKQLHKLIETINSWDIKLYTSYFKT